MKCRTWFFRTLADVRNCSLQTLLLIYLSASIYFYLPIVFSRNGDHVLPLYCFDPQHFGPSYHFGFERTAQFRAKLLVEAVEDLRQTMLKHGSNLIVRHQNPVEAVKGKDGYDGETDTNGH